MIVPITDDSPDPAEARAEALYAHLPAIYRLRDEQIAEATPGESRRGERRRGPLFELLRVIAAGAEAVEQDIARLYNDAFIETCDDWVVPYIADLVGYRPVADAGEPGSPHTPAGQALNKALTSRREVARTIYLRRRKGALHLLEQLARDVADWPARAVEGFERVALLHTARRYPQGHGATVSMGDASALGRLGGPFEGLTRTVDLRGPEPPDHIGRPALRDPEPHSPEPRDRVGRPALRTVTLYVWTTRAYPVTFAPPTSIRPGCYTFDPTGIDIPLYINPTPKPRPADIAGELNLPVRLRTQALVDHKQALYGPGLSLCVYRDDGGGFDLVPVDQIIPADLPDADGGGWEYWPYADGPTLAHPPDGHIAVDPERGRLMARNVAPRLRVSYHYGFSADLGAGEYLRTERAADKPVHTSTCSPVTPVLHASLAPDGRSASLDSALQALADGRTVELIDSGLYELTGPRKVIVPPGAAWCLRAGSLARPTLAISDIERESHLFIEAGAGSTISINGLLLLTGSISITGSPARVIINNCTLAPGGRPRLTMTFDAAARTTVEISRSILGPVAFYPISREVSVTIRESIIVGARTTTSVLNAYGSRAFVSLRVDASTVIGSLHVRSLQATNSIFAGRVRVAHDSQSKASHCYLANDPGPDPANPADAITRVNYPSHLERPRFVSTTYGHPQLCRLGPGCPDAIRRGADDGGELGAYHHLYLPQREAVLRARLEEYSVAAMDPQLIIVE